MCIRDRFRYGANARRMILIGVFLLSEKRFKKYFHPNLLVVGLLCGKFNMKILISGKIF